MSIAQFSDGFTLDADGFAVPQADLLADFLAEHQDDESSPEDWPAWVDDFRWELGPGDPAADALADLRHTATFLGDDCHPIHGVDITDACNVIEQALNAARNDPPYEPSRADFDWLLDQEERRELARFYGCNARFV
ncbi:MAG: hypothetical protein ACLP53_22085 [Isosphaeraceae bacterium]